MFAWRDREEMAAPPSRQSAADCSREHLLAAQLRILRL